MPDFDVRSKPVSGRDWKEVQTKRSSAKGKVPRPSFTARREQQAALQLVKTIEKDNKVAQDEAKKERRLRAEEHAAAKLEAEKAKLKAAKGGRRTATTIKKPKNAGPNKKKVVKEKPAMDDE